MGSRKRVEDGYPRTHGITGHYRKNVLHHVDGEVFGSAMALAACRGCRTMTRMSPEAAISDAVFEAALQSEKGAPAARSPILPP